MSSRAGIIPAADCYLHARRTGRMQDLKGAERPPLRILEPDETVHTFAPAVDSKCS